MTKDTERLGTKGHLAMLLIMSTAYIAVFGSIQGFKAMLPLVRDEFAITGAQAGLYATFFYASGVILAIFSGRIVDAVGARKGLLGGVTIIMTLMLLHTLMPVFSLLLLLALFTGIGFSIVTPSINKGVIELVDSSRRAVSNGIVHAGGGIGGILGSSILPMIGERFGWRTSLVAMAFVALAMAGILFKFFHPVNNYVSDEEKDVGPRSFKADLKKVATDPRVLLVTLIGIMAGLSVGNITIHYTLFLTDDLGFSPSLAGVTLSVFIAGGIIGNPLYGYVNDRFFLSNRRIGLFVLGLIVAAMFAVLAFYFVPFQPERWVVVVLSFVFGFFSFAIMGMMFTTLGDVAGPRYMGMATGLMLVFTRMSMMIGPPIVGRITDVTGDYALGWKVIALIVLVLIVAFYVFSHKYRHLLKRN